MSPPPPPRERLRTSQQAHARIRWDERLARRPFVLLIDDRPAGTRTLPLDAFEPDGDIPWHRIRQITLGGLPVWCRERRLDLLDEVAHWPDTSVAVRPVARAAAPTPDGLTPLTPRAAARPAGVSALPARVATFNALTDAFDADLIASERRWPAVVARLGELDADLIGLSEVTPQLAELLDRAPWASEHDRSDEGDGSVRPHGQMLLSRWPIRSSGLLELTPTRRVLCCDVDAPTGPLRVLVLHLVSNATRGAAEKRREELARVLALLPDGGDAVVMGDFNLTGDELAGALADAGLADAWTSLLPDDPGLSYDPARNPLAALFSRDGQGKRYDRILWRAPDLTPCAARLFATAPVSGEGDAGLFPSDHFGVVVDLRVGHEEGALDRASPTYHSALALVPPPSLWSAIEPRRAAHDRGFGRWMPHITLLHGFAPAPLLGEALERVQRVCRTLEPFEVTLTASGRFEHAGSRTLWLDPRGDGSLARLQAALQREFPRLGEPGAEGFTPHLTVARFPSSKTDESEALERELRRDWRPERWRIDAVHLLARRGDRPVESVLRVELGAGTARGGDGVRGERDPWRLLSTRASDATRAARSAAVALVGEAIGAVTAARELPAAWIEPVGSSRICPELPDGDVDLLLVTPVGLDAPDALTALDRELRARGAPSRRVVGAHVDAVRTRLGGVDVDITVARSRSGEPGPASAITVRALETLPVTEQLAVLSAHDAAALEHHVGDDPGFATLLGLVRRWAGARALRGQWAGYLGGLSWAVLVARCCLDHPTLSGGALLARFFATEAERPWPACVSLCPVDEARWLPASDGSLIILAPALPGRDTARSLIEPTARVLREELRRAASLTAAVERHRAAAGELFAPPATDGHRLELTVAGKPGERAERRGQVEGALLGLVRALATASLSPRPLAAWRGEPGGDRLTVLLGPGDDPVKASRIARTWSERLGGLAITAS